MADLNQVFLIGRLARDPELRYVPSGKAVANLDLATNRVFTTQEGEKREEACFVRIVVWGKQAESCSQYLNKGSQVCVEGRLQSRSWETEDGAKRNTLEVVARRVQFLDKIGKSTGGEEINREEAGKAGEEGSPSSGGE